MPSDNKYTIGIIGVRDHKGTVYANADYVVSCFNQATVNAMKPPTHSLRVVTGGGRGVEELIVNYCAAKGIPCDKIPPNIAKYGNRKAFIVRNSFIVGQCDELIMFWDGNVDLLTDAIMSAMHSKKKTTCYPVI